MNFFAANPIEVPTKLYPSSCEDNGNGGDIIDRRRRSSASLDVAATIFSSIQELEANGRNLSSLGLSSIGLGSRGVPGEMAGGGGHPHLGGIMGPGFGMGGGIHMGVGAGLGGHMGGGLGGGYMGGFGGLTGGGGGMDLHHHHRPLAASGRDALVGAALGLGLQSRQRTLSGGGRQSKHPPEALYRPYKRRSSTRSSGSENIEALFAGMGAHAGGGGGGGDRAGATVSDIGAPPLAHKPSSESSSDGGGRYPPNGGNPAMMAQAQRAALWLMEMEEMRLLQKQQQQHRDNWTSTQGNLKGGYAPVPSNTIRGADSRQPHQQEHSQSSHQQLMMQQQQIMMLQGQLQALGREQHLRSTGGQREWEQQQTRRMSSSSLSNRNNSLNSMDFTPEELLLEVKRRQSRSLSITDECGVIGGVGGEGEVGGMVGRGGVMNSSGANGMANLEGDVNLVDLYNRVRNGITRTPSKNLLGGEEGGGGGIRGGGVGGAGSSSGIARPLDNGTSSTANGTSSTANGGRGGGEAAVRSRGRLLPSSTRKSSSEGLLVDGERGGELGNIIITVPTANPISKSTGRKRQYLRSSPVSTIVNSDAPAEGGDDAKDTDKDGNGNENEDGKRPRTKKPRQNSSTSFDALLSAFDVLDRENNAESGGAVKEEDDNRSSSSFPSSVEMTDGRDKRDVDPSHGEASHHPVGSDPPRGRTMGDPSAAPGTDTHAGPRHSQMAMIEMAMMQEQLVMHERALREQDDQLKLQHKALRVNALRERIAWASALGNGGGSAGVDPDIGHSLTSLLRSPGVMSSGIGGLGPIASGGGGPLASMYSPSLLSPDMIAMLARLQGLPGSQAVPSLSFHDGRMPSAIPPPARDTPAAAEPRPPSPEKIIPQEALQLFLDTFGDEAKKSREDMLRAISETEKSLVDIHAWDRRQGLRKCHSRTVVKTRRSRASVKAFLMGVDAPREPHKKRKRKKQRKQDNLEDFEEEDLQ